MQLDFLKTDARKLSVKVNLLHDLSRRLMAELARTVDARETMVIGQFTIRLNAEGMTEIMVDTRVSSVCGTVSGSLIIGHTDDAYSDDPVGHRIQETRFINWKFPQPGYDLAEQTCDRNMLERHYNIQATMKHREKRVALTQQINSLIFSPVQYQAANYYRFFLNKHGAHEISEHTQIGPDLQPISMRIRNGERTLCWFQMLAHTAAHQTEKTYQVAIIDEPELKKISTSAGVKMPLRLTKK